MTAKEVFFRTGYNYDTNQASDEAGLLCLDESLAQQSFAEEVDINTIVRRFGLTGTLPQGVVMPTYGDFTGVEDYRGAIEAVRAAEASFMALPADVRARFDNDPGLFVDFCSDPVNLEEAQKLGLVVKKEVQAPPAPGVPPSDSAAK